MLLGASECVECLPETEGLKGLDLGVDNEMVKATLWVWVPSLKPLSTPRKGSTIPEAPRSRGQQRP